LITMITHAQTSDHDKNEDQLTLDNMKIISVESADQMPVLNAKSDDDMPVLGFNTFKKELALKPKRSEGYLNGYNHLLPSRPQSDLNTFTPPFKKSEEGYQHD